MKFRRGPRLPLPRDPDCDAVNAVMQAYLDGELGPEDAEVVADHLRFCERCGIESATIGRVVDAIRRHRPDLDTEPLERLAGFVDRLTQDGPPKDPHGRS